MNALYGEMLRGDVHTPPAVPQQPWDPGHVESGTVSSLQRLPFDVLGLIFVACLDGPVVFPLRRIDQRMVLSQVCSWWRHCALATPALWNDIAITVLDPITISPILSWIERCGESYISLVMIRSGRTWIDINEVAPHVLLHEVIMPFRQRFKKLQLLLDGRTLGKFMNNEARPFDFVTDLSLVILDVKSLDPIVSFDFTRLKANVFSFRSAKNIHPARTRDIRLPWQITTLRLREPNLPPHRLFTAIQCCETLQDCTLGVPVIDDVAAQALRTMVPICFPVMRNLTLEWGGYGNIPHYPEFLRLFVIPRLSSLSLDVGHVFQWDQTSFASLINRSSCLLEQLSITYVGESVPIGEILHLCPQLREARLGSYGTISSPTLALLSAGQLGCHLEHLEIGVKDLGSFLGMVKARQARAGLMPDGNLSLSRLRTVCVQYEKVISRAEMDQWQALQKDGLTYIDIEDPNEDSCSFGLYD